MHARRVQNPFVAGGRGPGDRSISSVPPRRVNYSDTRYGSASHSRSAFGTSPTTIAVAVVLLLSLVAYGILPSSLPDYYYPFDTTGTTATAIEKNSPVAEQKEQVTLREAIRLPEPVVQRHDVSLPHARRSYDQDSRNDNIDYSGGGRSPDHGHAMDANHGADENADDHGAHGGINDINYIHDIQRGMHRTNSLPVQVGSDGGSDVSVNITTVNGAEDAIPEPNISADDDQTSGLINNDNKATQPPAPTKPPLNSQIHATATIGTATSNTHNTGKTTAATINTITNLTPNTTTITANTSAATTHWTTNSTPETATNGPTVKGSIEVDAGANLTLILPKANSKNTSNNRIAASNPAVAALVDPDEDEHEHEHAQESPWEIKTWKNASNQNLSGLEVTGKATNGTTNGATNHEIVINATGQIAVKNSSITRTGGTTQTKNGNVALNETVNIASLHSTALTDETPQKDLNPMQLSSSAIFNNATNRNRSDANSTFNPANKTLSRSSDAIVSKNPPFHQTLKGSNSTIIASSKKYLRKNVTFPSQLTAIKTTTATTKTNTTAKRRQKNRLRRIDKNHFNIKQLESSVHFGDSLYGETGTIPSNMQETNINTTKRRQKKTVQKSDSINKNSTQLGSSLGLSGSATGKIITERRNFSENATVPSNVRESATESKRKMGKMLHRNSDSMNHNTTQLESSLVSSHSATETATTLLAPSKSLTNTNLSSLASAPALEETHALQ